jgi:thiaminase/transcriptional activator TenA
MAQERSGSEAFTRQLWQAITPIFNAILAHPFIQGLTDGRLPRESFVFYVVQDALYLREFARALSLAAAKAPQEEWIITFNEHAAGALRVERALHEGFFREFGLSEEAVRATPLAPTNLAYTSYLIAVAYARPIHELVAALLPWVKRWRARARRTRCTSAGSIPMARRSSARWSRRS